MTRDKQHRWSRVFELCLSLAIGGVAGCDERPIADEASAAEFREVVGDPLPGAACLHSKDCVPEEYCLTPEGECGRVGVCVPAPLTCLPSTESVCSCEGVTYRSACEAAIDKTSIDFQGACPPPSCTDNTECDPDSYCAKATNDCGGTGSCELRPASCPGAWNPVCGCDGGTYANGCQAAQAGVAVAGLGTC